jgi:hypothetical protein
MTRGEGERFCPRPAIGGQLQPDDAFRTQFHGYPLVPRETPGKQKHASSGRFVITRVKRKRRLFEGINPFDASRDLKKIYQNLLFVKLSRSLQISSIFWTSSGSCPLCLTPPCYRLEPPASAAPFLCNC